MPARKGSGAKPIDLTGLAFGEWTVTARSERKPGTNGTARWDVVCSCGNTSTVSSQDLRLGKTSSCRGCAAKRRGKAMEGREGFYHLRRTPQEPKPPRPCADCGKPLSRKSLARTVRCRPCADQQRQGRPVGTVKPKVIRVKVPKAPKVPKPVEMTRIVPAAEPRLASELKRCQMCLRPFRGEGYYCREACEVRAVR